MLQNCLGINLNPLGDSGATTNLHRNFSESCYFVIQHEVAVLYKRLIMICEVVLEWRREAHYVWFIAASNWIYGIRTSSEQIIDVDKARLSVSISVHYWKSFDTALYKYDISKVFDRGRRQEHVRESVLVKAYSS